MISKDLHAVAQSDRLCAIAIPGVSKRPEILGWIEAEIAEFSDPTCMFDPFRGWILGANRLGRIFNHWQTVVGCRSLESRPSDSRDRTNGLE